MYWFTVYVFANVLLLTLLSFNVSRLRIKEKVGLGDGGKSNLNKAIRSHANGVEHALPFGLIILSASINREPLMLPYLVIGFTLARIVHAVGMIKPTPLNLRRVGATITYIIEVIGLLVLGLSLFS